MEFQVGGLALDMIGVLVIARAVVISRATAKKLAATSWNGNERLQAALERQSRLTCWGAGLMILGFILQIVGIWISSS